MVEEPNTVIWSLLEKDCRRMVVEPVAFECHIIEGEPTDIGCEAHAWVKAEELGPYDLLLPDRALARLLTGRSTTNG